MDDIERLRAETNLSDLAMQEGIALQRNGAEWEGLCPFHDETTPSFTIFRGKDGIERFHCFGCAERGDAIDFIQKLKGFAKRDAIKYLGGGQTAPNVARKQITAHDHYAGITLQPVPVLPKKGEKITLYNPKRSDDPDRAWGSFKPSAVYPYYNAGGEALGAVLRHDLKDGKETPMVAWVRLPDGTECWCRFPLPKPRPLYRLQLIADGQVIVVEGEKCADWAANHTGRTFVSWAGGTYGVDHTDWSPLAGRKVLLWPDFDAPGVGAMDKIACILTSLGCTVRLAGFDLDQPPTETATFTPAEWQAGSRPSRGWDVADAVRDGWTIEDIVGFMRATVRDWKPTPVAQPEPTPPTPDKKVVDFKPVTQAKVAVQVKPATSGSITSIAKPNVSYNADDAWRVNLMCKEDGITPKGNLSNNWGLYLEHHDEMHKALAFDAFRMVIMINQRPAWEPGNDPWTPRTLIEEDYQRAVDWLERKHMTPKASSVVSVIQSIAKRQSYDELTDYLEGLVWDGVPRVDRFYRDYFGVTGNDQYVDIVSRCYLISAVARGLRPGCKVDTMPIIEGGQGIFKSSGLKALHGAKFFSDELSDIGSKDAKMEMMGVWCIEIAEMHRLNLSAANDVKKFLSQSTDRFRPPYGRVVIEAPRRSILAGTINLDGNPYLKDSTGARRFWPMKTERIDIDAIHRDRDQIWAEAVLRFKKNETWWVTREQEPLFEEQTLLRTEVDVWTDAVARAVEGQRTAAIHDILIAINVLPRDAGHTHQTRIAKILHLMGWTTRRNRKHGADSLQFVAPVDSKGQDEIPW